MSHSCRHISSHKHQLRFFRGKKRSFERKPGVSLDNTFNTSSSVSTVHLPKQTEKIFSMLVSDCWHVLNTQDFPFGWFYAPWTLSPLILDRLYTLNTNNSVHVLIYSSIGWASLHMFATNSRHTAWLVAFSFTPHMLFFLCLSGCRRVAGSAVWPARPRGGGRPPELSSDTLTLNTPSNTPRKTCAIQYSVSGKCNFSWHLQYFSNPLYIITVTGSWSAAVFFFLFLC